LLIIYGHDFKVIPGVLCPRPDTETMVEQGLLFLRNSNQQKSYSVLDLCTGTGCIALSLEAEWNDTAMNVPIEISASDISEKSVLCFSQNHQNFKSNAQFIKSDLFQNIKQRSPGSLDVGSPSTTNVRNEKTHGRKWLYEGGGYSRSCRTSKSN
jgi:HemK-like putative methylase